MENKEFSIPKFLVNMEEPVKQNMERMVADTPPITNLNGIRKESQGKCCAFGSNCRKMLALIYICFMGFFALFCYDMPGSLETEIETTFRVQPYEFEYLYSMYCFPNIVLAFCSGILIDRVFGIKRSALLVALITLVGQIIFTVGGFVKMYWILLVARFIYGVGGDSIMVVINYYTVLWFEGTGLNFVFGMGMSMARLGTSFVFLVSAYSYSWMEGVSGDQDIRIGSSFSISIISGLLILLCVLGWETERSGKQNLIKSKKLAFKKENKKFNLKEIFVFPIKYWLMTIVFVSVQTAVLVFVTCSQKLLMTKYKISSSSANHLGSVFNLVVALSCPLAGILVDRIGFNLLLTNLALLVAALSQLFMAFFDSSPYLPLILLGISCGVPFSSVLPLTSKIVPASKLGAAFGMTIALSDLSLAVLNILAGYLLGQFGSEATCLFYASLFLVGLLCGVLLWICDRIDGGTLQE